MLLGKTGPKIPSFLRVELILLAKITKGGPKGGPLGELLGVPGGPTGALKIDRSTIGHL